MLKVDFPDRRSPDLTRSYSSAAVSYFILAWNELEPPELIVFAVFYLFNQQLSIAGLSLVRHAGLLPVLAPSVDVVGKLHKVFVHLVEMERELQSIIGNAVMDASCQIKRMSISSLATVRPSNGLVHQAAQLSETLGMLLLQARASFDEPREILARYALVSVCSMQDRNREHAGNLPYRRLCFALVE